MSSEKKGLKIYWDADGVLVDSQKASYNCAEKILRLLERPTSIKSQSDYRKYFANRNKHIGDVSEEDAEILRAMHRLSMRESTQSIPVFREACEIFSEYLDRSVVVTAAHGNGIRGILKANGFDTFTIVGRESGKKESILGSCVQDCLYYITDTVTDIKRCRKVGIPVAAVIWGYDTERDLIAEKPDFILHSAGELRVFLKQQIKT